MKKPIRLVCVYLSRDGRQMLTQAGRVEDYFTCLPRQAGRKFFDRPLCEAAVLLSGDFITFYPIMERA